MTQTRYRCLKLGMKGRKPVAAWLAFGFSLSSDEVLWQFLAFGPGLVLTGAWLRVPFWHSLDNTGAVPVFHSPPSLSLHPSPLS